MVGRAWGPRPRAGGSGALGCKQEVLAARKRRSSLAATTDSWGRGAEEQGVQAPVWLRGPRAGGRAGGRARSSPGRKRTFHTLAWRDLQPARCNGGGLCAAPTLEPRSLKMISTSKIFPNCCRDRERRGGRQEKGVMTAAALTIPLPRYSGKEDPRDALPFFLWSTPA